MSENETINEVKENLELPSDEVIQAALAPEEPDELADLSEEEKAVAAKILPKVTKKILFQVRQELEAKKAQELQQALDILKTENQKALDEFYKANKPLEPQEIEKLLSEEYLEFKVKLATNGNNQEFVIRELTQAAEMRFLKYLQKELVPHLKTIAAIEWTPGASVSENLQRLIEFVPDIASMASELCATCLDPNQKHNITAQWVQENLSTRRVITVIQAQIQAGRYRDFFSLGSRVLQTIRAT